MTDQSFKREQVVEIVGSVVNRLSVPAKGMDQDVVNEVHALKQAIDELHQELNTVHPGEIQSHIPDVTQELDAIVATTEEATHTIMEACESIQNHVGEKGEGFDEAVNNDVIKIIETCTFQDLTGQRITKIVSKLNVINKHAGDLIEILQSRFSDLEKQSMAASVDNAGQPPSDKDLMNGPALPGQGVTQEDIDKLLDDLF